MTPRGKRRGQLTEADVTLWLKVASSVAPLPGARLPDAPPKPVTATAPPPSVPDAPAPRAFPALPGYVPPVSTPGSGQKPPLAPFEKRYRQRVTRGREEIDGVMDLHGLTQAQAHMALIRFLRTSQGNGARLVLVVTGKGRSRSDGFGGFDTEPGVLRRAVPNWLRDAELRSIVLGFEEAGLPHGGMGALYIRLRKAMR